MGIDPISIALDIGSKIIDKIWPDPATAAQAKLDLFKLNQTGELAQLTATTDLAKGQLAVNQEEAKSTNMFIAGGRPFVMWICGTSLAYVALIEPIGRFVATVYYHYNGAFPVIDTSLTMQVLLGLLGLGGMRTVEKIKGAEGNR